MVQGTSWLRQFPASNVLILGEEDAFLGNDKYNYWLADHRKTTGQGFTIKVDTCAQMIAGCQVKNLGRGPSGSWATKGFRVRGSLNENGPWETLLESDLVEASWGTPVSLLNFTFKEPVKIQYLKFDLISYWGGNGGGLQYFAAIPATSKQH